MKFLFLGTQGYLNSRVNDFTNNDKIFHIQYTDKNVSFSFLTIVIDIHETILLVIKELFFCSSIH